MIEQKNKTTADIMFVLGTRPELIKVASVIDALKPFQNICTRLVSSSQQADLMPAFIANFGVTINHDLDVMSPNQPLNQLLARTIANLDKHIAQQPPCTIVVQGDTTTALAGALAANMRLIPIVHIEAGLRTGDPRNPFPEEINRKLISQMATLHCAATPGNRDNLIQEGIPEEQIEVTGNPIVNALDNIITNIDSPTEVNNLLHSLSSKRLIVLTTHRRESFGTIMEANLQILKKFLQSNPDTSLVIPVHPNPSVQRSVNKVLAGTPRVVLIQPMDYPNFIHLLKHAWLVVSDSGGIQEEVASLGKPLLILRRNTERPEIVDSGMARVVGKSAKDFEEALAQTLGADSWVNAVNPIHNPFGDINSSSRIAQSIVDFVERPHEHMYE